MRWPSPRRLLALVVGALLLAGPPAAAGADGSFQVSRASSAERSLRGVLAVRGGRVLAAEQQRHLFVPASVLKLVVAATALHHLGPEHRRTTVVRATGPLRGATLRGDLVLEGQGDPSWNRRFHPGDPHAPLSALARQLRARGLRAIRGDLVLDVSRFSGPVQGRDHPPVDRAMWYGAPVSALAVDENVFTVKMAPGSKPGRPGRLWGDDSVFTLHNRITTVGRSQVGNGTVGFYPSLDGRTLEARGEYPLGEPPYVVRVSVPDPERAAGEAFRKALKAAGISIKGDIRIAHVAPAGTGKALASVQSPPLAELLRPALQDSHNWYAEMLLRIVALEAGGAGRLDLGLDLERELLEQQVRLPANSFQLEDASGLSPANLIAPEAVVALLLYVLDQPWRDVFVDALAAPESGTLRAWGKLPPLRAKTGTIAHTIALAGYLEPSSARPVVFAALVNHWQGSRGAARKSIAGLLREWAGRGGGGKRP